MASRALICDYWVFVDLPLEMPSCFVFANQELDPRSAAGKYRIYPDKDEKKWDWWLQVGSIYDEKALEKWDKIWV